MQTGEGKTLAAVLPAALNALTGNGVHVLTFNDYLARRDAGWMGPIYRRSGSRWRSSRKAWPRRAPAYAADVTYVTAKEAGFDHLRDLLARRRDDVVQAVSVRADRRGRLDPDRRGARAPSSSPDPPIARHRSSLASRIVTGLTRACTTTTTSMAATSSSPRPARAHRAAARLRQPARRGQPAALDRDQLRAARPHPAQARRRLPGPRRPDRDHRRAHRPGRRRPALAGRPPGGARSEGRARPKAGRPNPRIDHAPALHPRLPAPVRMTGPHRPQPRARRNLRRDGDGHSDAPSHDSRRSPGSGLGTGRRRKRQSSRRSRRRTRPGVRSSSARSASRNPSGSRRGWWHRVFPATC